MLRARPRHPAGLTLAEMLVTVAVLALTASIVVPSAAPTAPFAVDAAAGEVARAVRFAQREAVRTGAWHTVHFDVVSKSLVMYRLTATGQRDKTNLVLHPVDKAGYEIRFGDMPGSIGQLANVEFKYKNRPVTNLLSFRPDGAPANLNPSNGNVDLLERDGKVVLAQGAVERSVTVARVTGRVTW